MNYGTMRGGAPQYSTIGESAKRFGMMTEEEMEASQRKKEDEMAKIASDPNKSKGWSPEQKQAALNATQVRLYRKYGPGAAFRY